MKAFKFVCKENDESRTLGWLMEGMDGFDPLGGLTVAHDVLEHFPGGDESAADEFQAFGAILYLRGCTGYMRDAHTGLSGDFTDIWYKIESGELSLASVAKDVRPLDDWQESLIVDNLAAAKNELIDSVCDYSDLERFLHSAGQWMRIGYRRAAKRFRRYDAYGIASCVFDEIMRLADKALAHAEEGDVLRIVPNLTRYSVKVTKTSGWAIEAARGDGWGDGSRFCLSDYVETYV